MTLSTKHILGLEQLPATDITLILDTAQELKKDNFLRARRQQPLQGKTVVNLFHEPSHAHPYVVRDGRTDPRGADNKFHCRNQQPGQGVKA